MARMLRAGGDMHPLRLGSTLLIVALAAITLAPPSGRTDVLRLASGPGPASYEALMTSATPEMVGRVAALLARTFDVPLPQEMVLHLYPSQMTFAHGLVRDLGLAPHAALEFAGSAVGLASPRTVFLLADGMDRDRVRLVAHEVMHLVQHELAGPTARPAQWLMEGTAEWAALTLLERLGAAGITERTGAARAAARLYLAADPAFTPAMVRRSADFRRWQRRVGDVIAYQVAYAMAEQLAIRHGAPAVMAYFRAFRDDSDPAKNFEGAFGTSTAEFIVGARASIGVTTALRKS